MRLIRWWYGREYFGVALYIFTDRYPLISITRCYDIYGLDVLQHYVIYFKGKFSIG